MASTSSSSVLKSFKCDVFLSFRGEDTVKTFVDHLYHALQQKDITTYKDDERIEKGERISDEVIRSIEDSRFHIIVFSKNYADSSWCLEELLKIMECHKTGEQIAYAIFYDVEPTEVRNQSGAGGKHEFDKNFFGWRGAMREAVGLVEWELKTTGDRHEANVIQEIVEYISFELRSINPSFDKKLVGIDTRVKEIVSSLEIGSDDVRMIVIKGIGGGGKTTLARAVFDHIYTEFEGKSFVENVREASKGSLSGLKKLQKQVLQDVSNDKTIDITSVSNEIYMTMMHTTKILLVLDDVDNMEQLEALAGSRNWFKPGSRIIITTRDEQMLVAYQVNCIHDVKLLSDEEAICLFSRYAFVSGIPNQWYEELSKKVIHYTDGLPLTIKLLGSHLFGKTKSEWLDVISRLKAIPLKETLKILELSYNGLVSDHKELFLDVVCIFKGEKKNKAIEILKGHGINAKIGLRVLKEKSLITISNDGRLGLHDLIEEMGRNIVRRLHPNEPYKHSRLWIEEEIEEILVKDLGSNAIRSIKLEYALHPAKIMKGLRNMKELKYLYVYDKGTTFEKDQVDQYFPDTLQSIHWSCYPFCCLPNTFEANNLVNLEMPRSNISQLWDKGDFKVLRKLKYLNLNGSKLSGFHSWMAPSLVELHLEECNALEHINIYSCETLTYLNLSGSKLTYLSLSEAPCLEELHLQECNNFEELRLPYEGTKLKYLNLSGTKLRNLVLRKAPCLEELHLKECNDFVNLCLPDECPKLKYLNLNGSKFRNLILGKAPCLEELHLKECNKLVQVHLPFEYPKLKYLNLSGCKLSKLDLGMAQYLLELDPDKLGSPEELTLSSKVIEYFPDSMCSLRSLKSLELKSCIQLKELPSNLDMLEHLEKLHLSDCISLQEVPDSICDMKSLKYLHLPYCVQLKNLPGEIGSLKCLEELNIKDTGITDLPQSIAECPKLKNLILSGSKLSKLELSPNLVKLDVSGCSDFVELHMPDQCPKLTYLNLSGTKLSKLDLRMAQNLMELDLDKLESLEELILSSEVIEHLPDSMCTLRSLKSLELNSCIHLKHLPSDLGRLERLEKLHLSDCISLQEVPNSICNMKSLIYLHLPYCVQVMQLPEEIGGLKCLKELNIEGTGITDLPQSIYEVKGLCIVWSRGRLEFHGFTSIKKLSKYTASAQIW